MGFALEVAQPCKPIRARRRLGTRKDTCHPGGSIPTRGSRGVLGVRWDKQHPPAEGQSRLQAGSGAERVNPSADPAAHAQPLHPEKAHGEWDIWGCRLAFGLLGAPGCSGTPGRQGGETHAGSGDEESGSFWVGSEV